MTITISKKLKPINPSDFICVVYHGSGGGGSMSYHLLIESMARNYSIVLQELEENGGVQECSRAVCAAGLCC